MFAVLDLLAYILLPCRTWVIRLNLPSQCPLILVSGNIQSLTWAQFETTILKWTQAALPVLHYNFNSAYLLEVSCRDLEFFSIATAF